MVRSRDLIHWNPSPLNPVLEVSDEDKQIANPTLSPELRQRIAAARNINNSDIDFCELKGQLVSKLLLGQPTRRGVFGRSSLCWHGSAISAGLVSNSKQKNGGVSIKSYGSTSESSFFGGAALI